MIDSRKHGSDLQLMWFKSPEALQLYTQIPILSDARLEKSCCDFNYRTDFSVSLSFSVTFSKASMNSADSDGTDDFRTSPWKTFFSQSIGVVDQSLLYCCCAAVVTGVVGTSIYILISYFFRLEPQLLKQQIDEWIIGNIYEHVKKKKLPKNCCRRYQLPGQYSFLGSSAFITRSTDLTIFERFTLNALSI